MKTLIKLFLLSVFLLCFEYLAISQTPAKFGFDLLHYLKSASDDERVPLLIEGDPERLPTIVKNYNGTVRLQVQNLFSVDIPAEFVIQFSEEHSVKKIEFSNARGRSLSDTMLIQTNVDSIFKRYSPLRSSYTGKGVILGVIDSGIELAHDDFKDSLGNTRVLYVWDQGVAYNPSRKPGSYSYGVEWDSTSINAGISTHDDKAVEFGHGSNVTGAAASNALATGNFKGVAPEANIISVATDFRKPNWLQTVAEAVDYIYTKADALGMPCVINASVGTYLGSHDGLDIAARMIDALIQQRSGQAFVCAAGNAGTLSFHTQHQLNGNKKFSWFESEPSQFAGLGGVYFEIWSDTNDFKNVKFSFGADRRDSGRFEFRGRTILDSIGSRLNTIYVDSIMSLTGSKLAVIETYAEESQGRYKLEVAIINPDSSDYLFRLESEGNGKLDIWSSYALFRHNDVLNSNLPSVSQFPDIINYQKSDSLQTVVSSFSCLPSVITVGNYTNRASYIDVNGNQQIINVVPGQISPNSSLGPNRKGYLKPDICSAGDYMFAAGRLATIANAISSNPAKVSQDSLHYRNGGTSMASPTVAGMVALHLEQCHKSSSQKIKSDLISSAKSDQFTQNIPNPKWGNGKADGFNFLLENIFTPTIAPTPTVSFCEGDSVRLTASGGINYVWNTLDSSNAIYVKETGDYYAQVENLSGCVSPTDTVTLLFNPIPAKPILTQNGNTLSLSVNGSFLWYLNQSPLLNQRSSSINAQSSGDYYCIYTDNNGCSVSTDTVTLIITGLSENPDPKPKVYPNPAEETLNIDLGKETTSSIELYSMKGQRVFHFDQPTPKQRIELKVGHLNTGIYLLKIFSSTSVESIKLIIQ